MNDFSKQVLERGFLADQFALLIPKLREANSIWFSIAERTSDALNQCAARAMESVEGSSLAPEVVATLIGVRATGNFQAAILLANRGMVAEARTMIRGCVEASICLAALHDNPQEFVRLLKLDDGASRKAQAKFIIENPLTDDEAELDRLRAILSSIEGGRNLPIRELAGLGSYNRMYLYYRILSQDAAHISARSLHRHMTMGDEGWTGYQWGPDDPESVSETLNLGTLVVLGLGVALTQVVGDGVSNATFARLSEEHASMQPH